MPEGVGLRVSAIVLVRTSCNDVEEEFVTFILNNPILPFLTTLKPVLQSPDLLQIQQIGI